MGRNFLDMSTSIWLNLTALARRQFEVARTYPAAWAAAAVGVVMLAGISILSRVVVMDDTTPATTESKDIKLIAQTALDEGMRQAKAERGGVVVLDARSGVVLALVGRDAQAAHPGVTYQRTFAPGATLTPVLAAALIDSGVLTPASRLDTSPPACGRSACSG